MPRQSSIYQTHGVAYGNINPAMYQQQRWNNGERVMTQGFHPQQQLHQNVHMQPVGSAIQGSGYYQPTGINSGVQLASRNRSSSRSSSRSSDQSPSRLETWRRNRQLKRQQKQRSRMPMQTQYPFSQQMQYGNQVDYPISQQMGYGNQGQYPIGQQVAYRNQNFVSNLENKVQSALRR